MNLKPRFLIKSGYYIVPSPSTALPAEFGIIFVTTSNFQTKGQNQVEHHRLTFRYRTLYLSKAAPITGKFFSEALLLSLVNPQYDKGLFIEFPDKYKFRTKTCQAGLEAALQVPMEGDSSSSSTPAALH